jgi:hypothetical protein
MTESHVRTAARNNAEWCDAVCRTHGLPGEFGDAAWTNARRTPQFYPDAVTLSAAAAATDVLPGIDLTSAGTSIKDSFGCLDLTAAGFDVLFEASWIHRPAGFPAPEPSGDVNWSPVASPAELAAWAVACGGGQVFRSELLAEDGVVVLAGHRAGRITAGAIANRAAGVVGISNLFVASDDPDDAWAGAVGAVAARFPGLPIVGYERDDGLDSALRNGFSPIGPLRVWVLAEPDEVRRGARPIGEIEGETFVEQTARDYSAALEQ